jgi:hypothetical protein
LPLGPHHEVGQISRNQRWRPSCRVDHRQAKRSVMPRVAYRAVTVAITSVRMQPSPPLVIAAVQQDVPWQ